MRAITLLILYLFFTLAVKSQVSRTVELTPGSLATELTSEELRRVTDLTITGRMDARDFKTMRDSMPVLAVLDMSAVKIEAYTDSTNFYEYQENTIPRSNDAWWGSQVNYSLSKKTTLSTLVLPSTITEIGSNAFMGCTGLLEIDIPASVIRIDGGAFSGCTSLSECTLPSSVVDLGGAVFQGCSSLVSVTLPSMLRVIPGATFTECTSLRHVEIPATVNVIQDYAFSYCSSLENIDFPSSLTTIGESAFFHCTALTSVTIPSSVTSILGNAFWGCSKLATVRLPATLKLLYSGAFGACTSLEALYLFAPIPLLLPEVNASNPGVFPEIDKSGITLYVPEGSKALYEEANEWEDLGNIVEMPGFTLSGNLVTLEAHEDTATVELITDSDWTAIANVSWLTVSPSSGSGDAVFIITADENTSLASRPAQVVVTIAEGLSQDITVKQKGKPATLHVETAGTLSAYFSQEEPTGITRLTLTGEIDARDFKLIRDRMPFLETLDLGGTTIEAYSGPEGTDEYSEFYKEDEIPNNALENKWDDRKSRLASLVLPESVTAIGYEAFAYCKALQNVEIPSTVTTIHTYAFDACNSITEIIVPPSVTSIRAQAFRNCISLRHIELPSILTEIGNAAFEDCISLTSVTLPDSLTRISYRLFISCIALKTVEIGSAVTTIDNEAFFNCTSLDSLRIPASVTSIGYSAFSLCKSLTTLYAYPQTPPVLAEYFMGLPSSEQASTLYVPIGTKEAYASASEWKDFDNIIEMGSFSLEDTTIMVESADNSEATVKLRSTVAWTAKSNEEWLTVSPASGSGDQWLTLTADANPEDTSRIALVILKTEGLDSLILTVTQKGIAVGIGAMEAQAQVSAYPNPFTTEMAVDIANPSLREVSVEIYGMNGQKVKTLARAQKGQRISLVWKGEDEMGRQVPKGMYLVKVNGEGRKVVKE